METALVLRLRGSSDADAQARTRNQTLSVAGKHLAISLIVPWGLIRHKCSAPNVSGTVRRTRIKTVGESEIVPGRQGEDDSFARRIGHTERLPNRLTRKGEGIDAWRIGDCRRSSQIEVGILRQRDRDTWSCKQRV